MRFRLSSPRYPAALIGLLCINLCHISLAQFSTSAVACYQTVASGEYEVAIRHCLLAAQAGDSEAQYKLASLYAQGQGSPQDYQSSTKWLAAAAAQGHPKSQYELGFAYYHGHGLNPDPVKAAFWYKKAANKEHEAAQRSLAHMYELGDGINTDLAKAYYWYLKLAQQGNKRAQLRTGLMLIKGQGVTLDLAGGMQWITKAAKAQEHDAAYILGLLLIEEQPKQAIRWYRQASKQGHLIATYNLSAYLYKENPNSAALAEAKHLAEQAIKAGDKESVKLLALIEQKQQTTKTTAAAPNPTRPNSVQHLLALSPHSHTIQLVSLSSAQRAEKFINQHNIKDLAFYYPMSREDNLIHIVVYGEYSSRDAAKQAVGELPRALLKTHPFVQKIATLQKEFD